MERRRVEKEESDEEDGGEATNACYYAAVWNKTIKVRTMFKRVKHKRSQKRVVLRNVFVGTSEDLRRLHHERIHSCHPPLLWREFARQGR